MAALDPEKIAEIRRLAAEGVSAYRIAKQIPCSPASVQKYAPPGSFDRTQTAAAAQAHHADASARRAAQRMKYLDIVDDLQQRALAEYEMTQVGGVDGEVRRWTTVKPPARETSDLVRAAAAATAAELRIADRDDDGNLAQAVSLLDALVDGIRGEQ